MSNNKRLYAINIFSIFSILFVIAGVNVNGNVGISGYIDLPSLLFVIVTIFIATKLTKKYKNSFVFGGAVLSLGMSLVSILAQLKNPDEIGPAIAVGLIPIFYALIYIYFVSNIKSIMIWDDSITYDDNDLSFTKSYYIYQALFILAIVLWIILSGAGFGAYIDIPSLIMFIVLLFTIKMENKIKALYVRQNILLGFVLTNFMIFCIGILVDSSPQSFGPLMALTILSGVYALYYYIAWIKPKLSKVSLENKEYEMKFFSMIIVSIIFPFMYMLFVMSLPKEEKVKLNTHDKKVLKNIAQQLYPIYKGYDLNKLNLVPIKILNNMEESGFKYNIDKQYQKKTALMDAVNKNDYIRTKWFLEHGADVNIGNSNFNSLWSAFDRTKDQTKIYKLVHKYENKFINKNRFDAKYCKVFVENKYDKNYQNHCIKYASYKYNKSPEWFYLIGGDINNTIKKGEQLIKNAKNAKKSTLQMNIGHAYFIKGNLVKTKELYRNAINSINNKNQKDKLLSGFKTDFKMLENLYDIDMTKAKEMVIDILRGI